MAKVLIVDDAYEEQVIRLLRIASKQALPVQAVDAADIAPTWATVLAAGNETGVTPAVVTTGSSLQFEDGGGVPTAQIAYLSSGLDLRPTTGGTPYRIQVLAGGVYLFYNALQEAISVSGSLVRFYTQAGTQVWSLAGTAVRHYLPSGTLAVSMTNAGLAFFSGAAAISPSVTGAKAGNAALTSLLSVLSDMGLITDNTT